MDMFSALAEPTRRDILEMLALHGELSASDIYDEFDVTPPAVSQHLKVLRETNLVSVEKRAQQRIYKINTKSISELEGWIKKLTAHWEGRFERLEKILMAEKKKSEKQNR